MTDVFPMIVDRRYGGAPATETQWMKDQLARFTYKPGWTFEIITGPSPQLKISMRVEDTYHPGHMIDVSGQFGLYMFAYGWQDGTNAGHLYAEQLFARTLMQHIRDVEIHESREWFRRDGQIFDDPHQPRGGTA